MKSKFYFLNYRFVSFSPGNKARLVPFKHFLLQSILYKLLCKVTSLIPSTKLIFIIITALCISGEVLADYTVASGTTVNASTLTAQGGVLTVNGTLNVNIGTVSLLNFTSVVIDGVNAQIFWTGNNDLIFAAGISFVISNTSLGLQPTSGNGNGSTRLYIGTSVIIVSSDNSNNGAFSFELFNWIGGLPEFTLATSLTSICYGAQFTATLSPLCDKINYDCSWTVTPSTGTSITAAPGSTNTNFSQAQTFAFTYPNTPQAYTLTCNITRAGSGIVFTSASVNVSVSHVPAAPTLVTSSPAGICAGSSANINATTSEGIIQWYTAGSGGTAIGTSASAANFAVSPVANTTYYAEVKIIASGCASSTRIPSAVTVSQPAVGGSIIGNASVCTGTNNTLLNLSGYTGMIQWQLSTDNTTFNNITGFTASTFTASNLTGTTYYRALLSSGFCPSTISSVATVSVSPASVAGNIHGAVSVCTGTNSTLLTLAGNTGTIQWQSSTDNNSFSDIGGANSSTFAVTDLTATNYYRSVVTSGSCAPVVGSAVEIAVSQTVAGGIVSGGTAVCLGTNNTSLIVSSHIGNVVYWQSSATIDFSTSHADITNTSSTLIVTNISNAGFYRAVINNACGNAYSAPAAISIHNLWVGWLSEDWNTAANWSGGELPSVSCPDVTIPAGTVFAPVLGAGTATIHNLVILPGASVTVTAAILRIAGAIINAGTLNAVNGSLDFIGNSIQTISGNNLVDNSLDNLIISNNLMVNNTAGNFLNITGNLSFGDVDNATLNTGDNIVLVSTAAGTARLADITNNGANNGNEITGKVAVQRYLPARRAWRLFTAPLSYGGSIFDNWQNAGLFQAGKGTYVSGPGATSPAGSNGLDWSPQNNASLKEGSALTPVLNTRVGRLSKNLADTSDNIAYFIFARGDRDPVNTNPANSNITTLTSIGKLQTGRQTFAVSSVANAFTLIGNPYASSVEFAKIGRNNVYNRFYVWDPNLNSEQGGYVVFDDVNNTGTYSYTASNLTPVLQSGQAFFSITINNGPASLVFQENTKTPANNQLAYRLVNRSMAFRINLYHLNEYNATVLLDGTLALFDNNFSSRTDMQDALKANNVKEMLALKRDFIPLAIERRPIPGKEDTLFLQLTRTTRRSYRLGFDPVNLDANLVAFLEDSYTGKNIQLSKLSASVYDFEIGSTAKSSAPDRFRIVFRRLKARQLPIVSSINANSKDGNILVEWKFDNEMNISRYEVEKGLDAVNFKNVNSIIEIEPNRSNASYHWLDENPLTGNNFYRIRYIDINGKYGYSKTVLVTAEQTKARISVYPNPVAENTIRAEFRNMEAGVYNVKLISNAGQTIMNNNIRHAAGSWKQNIQPGSKLKPGIYQLKVTIARKQFQAVKVIVE